MTSLQVVGTKVEEVHALLNPYFTRLRLEADPPSMSFTATTHRVGPITVMDVGVSGVEVRASAVTAGYTVSDTHLAGSVTHGRDTIDLRRPFARPGDEVKSHFVRAQTRYVDIDQAAMGEFARTRLQDEAFTLKVRSMSATSYADAARWRAAARVAAEVARADDGSSPMVNATVAELVMSAFVSCFDTNWPVDGRPTASTAPAAVRRATAYIDENYAGPVTVGQIAAAARMSVRGLQAVFRRATGMTPMEYVRRARLQAAHEALRRGDPTLGDTVAVIARTAGFVHPSRFSAAYRELYGVDPRVTLRR